MTNREKLLAKDLQAFVRKERGTVKGSMKDYITVYRDFCKGNYDQSRTTRLYVKQSGEYCTLLEVLNWHYADHRERI